MWNICLPVWDHMQPSIKENNVKKWESATSIMKRLSEASKNKIIDDEYKFFTQWEEDYPEWEACYIVPTNFPIDTLILWLMRRIIFKTSSFKSNLSGMTVEELKDYAMNVLWIEEELEFV